MTEIYQQMSVSAAAPESKEESGLDDDVGPKSRYKQGSALIEL